MATKRRPRSRGEFEIAVICALPVEFDAIDALLEVNWEETESYGKALGDPNAYRIGNISSQNVVVAYLSDMGKRSSATAAAWLTMSFPNIKLGLVVGVCAGVPWNPQENEPIFLGDIVISTGVAQFDYGRQYSDRARTRDTLESNLSRPPTEVRAFLRILSSRRSKKSMQDKISVFLNELCDQEGFEMSRYLGKGEDKLYESNYRHKHQDTAACPICAKCQQDVDPVCSNALELSCAQLGCSDANVVVRERLNAFVSSSIEHPKPSIHFGRIASGDQVIKSSFHRDQIAAQEQVIAFEMEGAGVWEAFPTVVIKSVCDYADSHKNKRWQQYAAAAAASSMKAFLSEWRRGDSPSMFLEADQYALRTEQGSLNKGNDKTSFTFRELGHAAENGHIDVLKRAVSLGHDIGMKNSDGFTLMHCAAFGGQIMTVKYLQSLGQDIGIRSAIGDVPMQSAAAGGSIAMVDYLKSLGQDIGDKANSGSTPMHSAAANGQIAMIDHLKSLGQDISIRGAKGLAPMHYAAGGGHTAMVDHLKSLGQDIHVKENQGLAPMHLAAVHGQIAMIDHLKSLGQDIGIRSAEGLAPMHAAAFSGHIAVVDHLRELGEDFQVRDTEGLTPKDFAIRSGQTAMIKHLSYLEANKVA